MISASPFCTIIIIGYSNFATFTATPSPKSRSPKVARKEDGTVVKKTFKPIEDSGRISERVSYYSFFLWYYQSGDQNLIVSSNTLHSGNSTKHVCSVKEPRGESAVGDDGGGRHHWSVSSSLWMVIMDHVNNNTNTWMMIMSPTTPTLMPPTRQTAIVVTTGLNQGPTVGVSAIVRAGALT